MGKSSQAFRSIGEAASELNVAMHVLRFWEQRFAQLKPMKRGGGRRYYRPGDMALLRGIRRLLHEDGYTIKGVQKLLREQGVDFVKKCGINETGDEAFGGIDIPDLASETANKARAETAKRLEQDKSTQKKAKRAQGKSAKSSELSKISGDASAQISSPDAGKIIFAAIAELETCQKLLQKAL